MVNLLDSDVVYCLFGLTFGQTIGNCCFSAKHAALRRKDKEWVAQNLDIVSEWSCNSGLILTVYFIQWMKFPSVLYPPT